MLFHTCKFTMTYYASDALTNTPTSRPLMNDCAGWFPIKLEALPEGTCVHAHVPVYQVNCGRDCKYLGGMPSLLFGVLAGDS